MHGINRVLGLEFQVRGDVSLKEERQCQQV
jgi:hypothetical protein